MPITNPNVTRLQAFFRLNDCGWSEQWYNTEADPSLLIGKAAELLGTRMACSCADLSLEYARMSNITVFGDSVIVPAPDITFTPFGGPSDLCTEAWTALRLRIEATALHRNMRFMHGIPNDQIQGSEFIPSDPYTAALNVYTDEMINDANGWGIVFLSHGTTDRLFLQCTDAVITGLTTRHVGRPFGLQVGRRRRV